MPIVVNYDAPFGLIGQASQETGYGMARQRNQDIARQQAEADKDRQFKIQMMREQERNQRERMTQQNQWGMETDKRRFGYDVGRMGMQNDLMMKRQEEEAKAQMKYMKEQQKKKQYTDALDALNNGVVELPQEVQQENQADQKRKEGIKKTLASGVQGQSRKGLENQLAEIDARIEERTVKSVKKVPEHKRPLTFDERLDLLNKFKNDPKYEGVEVELDDKTGQPTFKVLPKHDIEKRKLELEYLKARNEALKNGGGSEKPTTENKRKHEDYVEAEKDVKNIQSDIQFYTDTQAQILLDITQEKGAKEPSQNKIDTLELEYARNRGIVNRKKAQLQDAEKTLEKTYKERYNIKDEQPQGSPPPQQPPVNDADWMRSFNETKQGVAERKGRQNTQPRTKLSDDDIINKYK